MRKVGLILLLAACTQLAGADDYKLMKVEQDVRNLERQVQELSRQIADLQRRDSRAQDRTAIRERAAPLQPGSPQWLDIENWNRLRVGMSEMEVISTLGPPTSMRGDPDSDSRTLLYAMEIGSSGFLGGSVQLKDRRVTELQKPVLK
ncbi:MAG TPA: hypothetical protein VNQ81_10300 [Povalibacter sp.]|nr:hypothetical protein [Povalibacter sp.]